jgi:uncharacterized membrane protein
MKKMYFLFQQIKKWLEMPKVQVGLGLVMVTFFTILYALLMLHRYWQFEYFFVDNVFFHSALWKMSRFEAPIVYHRVLGDINIFGDHFHPIIVFGAFLLMIIPSNEVIFVAMAVLYGLGAVFGLLIGLKLVKNPFLVYALLLAYFLYLGTQNAMIFGFHEINFVPPFLLMALYGFVTQKRGWYWLGITLLLLTKESAAVIVVGVAFFIALADRTRWKLALVTLLLAVGYYLLVTKQVIPYFSHGRFLYQAIAIPSSVSDAITKLTVPAEKVETFNVSVASFAVLPLLNLATLPLLLQDFLVRYLFSIPGNVQYSLTYHYGVATAPLLLFSSLWSVAFWQKKIPVRVQKYLWPMVTVVVTLTTLFFHRGFRIKGPLTMTLNPEFYRITQRNAFLWQLVEQVPNDGRIMAQNHLGLPLSHLDVYMLPRHREDLDTFQPRYLVYDIRDGQNPNNYFPSTETEFLQLVETLLASGEYRVRYHQDSMYILERVQ